MGTIGKFGEACISEHTAAIYDRGGRRRKGPILDLAHVQWERVRDDTAEGSVIVQGSACFEQKDFLDSIEPHRHELVIFRGRDRVFEGPVHRTQDGASTYEIVAHDVSEYLFNTPLTQDYSNANPNIDTVTGRIEKIIQYELTHGQTVLNGTTPIMVLPWEGMSPPANILPFLAVHHFPNEAKTSAVTVNRQMTVGEHLSDLARTSGIDWTTVGRSLHIWDVSRSLGQLRTLTETDFYGPVLISRYGADHAQISYVIGQDGVYGEAINVQNLDYYGPWTKIFTAYNEEGTAEPTQTELNSQARRNISGRSPIPLEVRVADSSGVVIDDTLTINQLVCGVQVPLRATLNARPLAQTQKIDHVVVTEDPAQETVQMTLTPATKPDSDVIP